MPVILLDKIPLPSLRVYTIISVLLLTASVYYAVIFTSDPNWKANSTNTAEGSSVGSESGYALVNAYPGTEESNTTKSNNAHQRSTQSLAGQLKEIFTFMIQEPLCIWTLINMAYCWLILAGRCIQRLVFGELRVMERQHVKDKFWNFVFYKFIFVFGVINVQYMDEVVLWCSWFSLLGFLHLLAQLCKDRFEYLSFSPTTSGWHHVRLLGLLVVILLLSGFMFLVCVAVGFFGGLNTFAFMVAECILLMIRTLHVILRYVLHLYDVRQTGGSGGGVAETTGSHVWERRGAAAYYVELVSELAGLLVDLLHHLHMLVWSNIFLSMASLVICMQLRYLFHEIQRRVKKHRNYLWVLNHMQQNYPMASAEELAENSDNCAICWEKMESARKLPCTHLFHNSCLQSWLEQDTSCPTCRMALSIGTPGMNSTRLDGDIINDAQQPIRRPPNHFFHFDGSRYVSWLPSFSVEVTHTQLLRSDQQQATTTSQLDAMARQVQQLFAHLPLSVIVEDLRITRSVELTIENVLDGRLVASPVLFREQERLTTQQPSQLNFKPLTVSSDTEQWEDLSISADSGEEPSSLGGRFSKSPMERERILHRRKEHMVIAARKRYLERTSKEAAAVRQS